jgi:hypothetical protein
VAIKIPSSPSILDAILDANCSFGGHHSSGGRKIPVSTTTTAQVDSVCGREAHRIRAATARKAHRVRLLHREFDSYKKKENEVKKPGEPQWNQKTFKVRDGIVLEKNLMKGFSDYESFAVPKNACFEEKFSFILRCRKNTWWSRYGPQQQTRFGGNFADPVEQKPKFKKWSKISPWFYKIQKVIKN